MKKPTAIIVGGGFAGLSAGVSLAAEGVRVTLVERRKHLGGRARSFTDSKTGDTVDNGQHLFMGCYHKTRAFLETIGTSHNLLFQDQFNIEFLGPGGKGSQLQFSRHLPAPVHVLLGFLRFSSVRLGDVLRLRNLKRDLKSPDLTKYTVDEWLDRCNQSRAIREAFWNPLCISALNQSPEEAPAEQLAAVVNQAIMGPREGARLGYSGVGLSELYTSAAGVFIENSGGKILLSTAADQIRIGDDRIHLRLSQDGVLQGDCLVCASPPHATRRLLPEAFAPLKEQLSRYTSSPILSVNLWFDRPITPRMFVALHDAEMDWVFNKHALYGGRDKASKGHIAMVASAASQLIDKTDEELVTLSLEDLRSHFPSSSNARLKRSLVVRERQATFVLPTGHTRPGNKTVHRKIFLAGDWTDTGLPPTIEAAVVSGQSAAELCLESLSSHSGMT
jgi:squalene-associated FAD-dependent desaturase